MRYSNELKVGLAIVIAAVIFVFGVRYFEDLPLFKGTYVLNTRFNDAQGLIRGSTVEVSGVRVGAVDEVELLRGMDQVHVQFHVDEGVVLPQGSYTQVTGFQALGGVRLEVVPGPSANPPVEEGGVIPSQEESMLSSLTGRAPVLLNRLDTLLVSADDALTNLDPTLSQVEAAFAEIGATTDQVGSQASVTLNAINQQLLAANGDLRRTLVSAREATESLNSVITGERDRLQSILGELEGFSSGLNQFTSENADTLAQTIQNLNAVLGRLNSNLSTLDNTTVALDRIILKIDRGDGTLGLLVNDPTLYRELTQSATTLNEVLQDFQANPGRYLRELQLVDIF